MRVASYTGLPGLLGAHQSEQRYAWMTGERDGQVRELFDGVDLAAALRVVESLRIRYIYVGQLERTAYSAAGLAKFERLVEEGYQVLDLPLPALITVVKEVAAPRLPTLRGKKRAKAAEIPLLTAADLDLESSYLGLKGSPTKVVKVATPKVTRGGTLVRAPDEDAVADAVDRLLAFLDARDLLPTGGRA